MYIRMEVTLITLGTPHTHTEDMPIRMEDTHIRTEEHIQMEEDTLIARDILQEVLVIRMRVLAGLIRVMKQVDSKGLSMIRRTIGLKCRE